MKVGDGTDKYLALEVLSSTENRGEFAPTEYAVE
jgi:hypothetical protein